MDKKDALINYSKRIADTSLILGQRLAEWCSKGPTLEEDLALTNVSLDLFGQARMLLTYAAELIGNGETEDTLAYRRNEREFYNALITERPNGHFGDTIARSFLLDAFNYHFYTKLKDSSDATISAFAEKSLKEVTYHLRHSSEWIVRLGDGTEESHSKIQKSINNLWSYTGDLFDMDEVDEILIKEGIAVDKNELKGLWNETVNTVLKRAKLERPADVFMHKGSLNALHSEHLGHLLCEMQYIPRAYPNAEW